MSREDVLLHSLTLSLTSELLETIQDWSRDNLDAETMTGKFMCEVHVNAVENIRRHIYACIGDAMRRVQ